MTTAANLFGPEIDLGEASRILRDRHYLGPIRRGSPYLDKFGLLVFANPTSRRLPPEWIELVRWCLFGEKNAGSRQWSAIIPWLRSRFPNASTVVSYSDPGHGHTGALYRASGWLWAPTWYRLRPPPTGNGRWDGLKLTESVKDRWVFPLLPDDRRAELLVLKDEAILRQKPWARYREPRLSRSGLPVRGEGGADYKRFKEGL